MAYPAAAQLPRSPKTKAFEGVVMYYGYRFYDPETGRWPSRDPIQEGGGVNLYGFVFNMPLSWIDRLGLLTISVNHVRKQYGIFATYGELTITTDDEEINKCCSFPYALKVLEPPITRVKHGLLKNSTYTGFIKQEDTCVGKSGRTCPSRFFDEKIPDNPAISDDYRSGFTMEFQVDPARGGNIHAGKNGASTDACLIVGDCYVPTWLDGDPSRQPGTENGKSYIVPGFDYNSSRNIYAKLMESVACAIRKSGGGFPKVKYSRTDAGAGRSDFVPKPYEGSSTGWTVEDLRRDYNPNYDGIGVLYALPVDGNSGVDWSGYWNKLFKK